MGDEEPVFDEEYDEQETTEPESSVELAKPTLSDVLLTPEDKLARREYRMNASRCCVDEAWRMYRRVTNDDLAIEPANLSSEHLNQQMMVTRMGVLYDPTAGLRMRFLKKKFAHLLYGFSALKEAAYRPFIRCQKPKRIDVDGQGFVMPAVAKAFHPEVYVTYTHPSTFAYKEKWSKIFNSNFISAEDMLRDLEDKDTQTMASDMFSTRRIRRPDTERDLTVERFDIEDIPLDSDGNPVGRSVGICEWCGHSILPMPSEYTLSVEWNIDSLYCCNKYRLFVEDLKKATAALEADAEKKHFLIDSTPRRKKKGEKKIVVDHPAGAKTKMMVGKMIKILQEKYEEAVEERAQHVGVDTSDLPWDPAETRYHQQMRVNAEDPTVARSTLKNIDILLELEEVYSNRESMATPNVASPATPVE